MYIFGYNINKIILGDVHKTTSPLRGGGSAVRISEVWGGGGTVSFFYCKYWGGG